MTTDTFLFNAGWIFFALWIAVITGVTIGAFGRDLLPWNTGTDSANQSLPTKPVPTRSGAR
jgi:hypothetical protein